MYFNRPFGFLLACYCAIIVSKMKVIFLCRTSEQQEKAGGVPRKNRSTVNFQLKLLQPEGYYNSIEGKSKTEM
jgi:hypothetical protein